MFQGWGSTTPLLTQTLAAAPAGAGPFTTDVTGLPPGAAAAYKVQVFAEVDIGAPAPFPTTATTSRLETLTIGERRWLAACVASSWLAASLAGAMHVPAAVARRPCAGSPALLAAASLQGRPP